MRSPPPPPFRAEDPETTLHEDPLAIFIVSTYVDGTPPEGAQWFCRWVAEAAVDERVGSAHLSRTRFAVLGCGNSLYGARRRPPRAPSLALTARTGDRDTGWAAMRDVTRAPEAPSFGAAPDAQT